MINFPYFSPVPSESGGPLYRLRQKRLSVLCQHFRLQLCAALLERIGVYPAFDFAGLGSLAARIAPGAAYAQQVERA